jgi:ABC-type Mn2+/Zn2+ transport system ATPase subunit
MAHTHTHSHALKIADLTVSYARIPALHHVAFEVRCGMCVALLGPNGAGKTTLLKTLAGLVQRESGTIHFHGREVRGATPDIAYLPQRGQIDWDFPTTVRGLVEMGRYLRLGWWRRYGADDERAVDAAISSGPSSPARSPRRLTCSCSTSRSPASTSPTRTT